MKLVFVNPTKSKMKIKNKNKFGIGIIIAIVVVIAIAFATPQLFQGRITRPKTPIACTTPGHYVSRGELAKLFAEKLRLDTSTVGSSIPDVPPSHPCNRYIEAMRIAGLLGDPVMNAMFIPDRIVIRAEFAALVETVYSYKTGLDVQDVRDSYDSGTPYFTDVESNQWFLRPVQTLYALGLARVEYRPAANLERSFAQEVIGRLPL